MTIEDQLKSLKAKADTARQAATRASVEYEAAVESRNKALQELKEEFGVDSFEEGGVLLAKMKEDLEDYVRRLEEELDAG